MLDHKYAMATLFGLFLLMTQSLTASEAAHTSDTIILKTEKHRGSGLFERLPYQLAIEELSEDDELLQVIPSDIEDPKLAKEFIDMKIFVYHRLRREEVEKLKGFLEYHYPAGVDTTTFPSELQNTFRIIYGKRGSERVYIVDENNNLDFRDDSVRVLHEMNYENPTAEFIDYKYFVHTGKELKEESTWVIIEGSSENDLRITVAHHHVASILINGRTYEMQIVNDLPALRFCFDSPKTGVTGEDGRRKDSLLLGEHVELGEYLKFGDSYYQFAHITNDGHQVTLIRQDDVSNLTGNQMGFRAADFECVTTSGESISLKDYQNEHLLLVNVTACWSKKMSYEYYKELSDAYHTKINLLAIDESPGVLQANIEQHDLRGPFTISTQNRSIKSNYREDFCSRLCFLINPDGLIIDKFEISDWEDALARHFP